MKPFFKKLNLLFERMFNGNKFEITPMEVLLMTIVIMLIVVGMEFVEGYAAKPQVVTIERKPKPKEG